MISYFHAVSEEKPTPEQLELLLLEETTEDWKGLWEICGALRADFSLSGSDAELGAIVTPVILKLLQRGLIKFRRNQWAKSDFMPVPEDQVDALLADKANWSVSKIKDYYDVWCAATDDGRRALALLLKQPPQN